MASGISVPVPSASSQAAASFASAASLAAATVSQSPAFRAIVGSSVPSISLPGQQQALNVGGAHKPSAFSQMPLAQPSSTSGAQLGNHSSCSSLPETLAPGLNGANLSAAVANMDACFNSLNGDSVNHTNSGGPP